MKFRRKRSQFMAAGLVLLLVSACASLEGIVFKSPCLEIVGGGAVHGDGAYSIGVLTIKTGPPPCTQIGHVNIKYGFDDNGDGELSPDEVDHDLNDSTPGDSVTFGALSGPLPNSGGSVIREITVTDTSGNSIYTGSSSA